MFYSKPTDLQKTKQRCFGLIKYLRANAETLRTTDEEPLADINEAFLVTNHHIQAITNRFPAAWNAMRLGSYLDLLPLDETCGIVMVHDKDIERPTSTRTHMRLPRIEHLLNLTPEDFFLFMQVLANCRFTSYGTTFFLELQNIEDRPFMQYFIDNGKTFRISSLYASDKWIPFSDIQFIAGLQPTLEGQFAALQYLAARQCEDVLQIPAETVINLELEWPPMTDDYCSVPRQSPLHTS